MTLADARALEPNLEIFPTYPAADEHALHALARWAQRYTPWAAPDTDGTMFENGGAAGLWLDITGCAHLFASGIPANTQRQSEGALLNDLIGRLAQGYGVRAGLADTPGAAWALARFAHPRTATWVIAEPGSLLGKAQQTASNMTVPTILAELPVAALRLPADILEALDRLGLRRIGDLAAMPRAGLMGRFGVKLAHRLDQLLGREDEAISPLTPVPDLTEQISFAEPLGHMEAIRRAIRGLLEKLSRKLETEGRGVRQLNVALWRLGGRVDRLVIGTSQATRSPGHLARLVDEQLDRLPPTGSINMPETLVETICLEIRSSTVIHAAQIGLATINSGPDSPPLLESKTAIIDVMGHFVDRLMGRLGTDAVIRLERHASHLPEYAQKAVPITAAACTEQSRKFTPISEPWVARPPRLLRRPEPVFAVAPVPDEPPILFRWQGHVHHVVRADGPERLAAEWWRPIGDHDMSLGTATRDYYRVEVRSGARFWLYRAGLYQDAADYDRAHHKPVLASAMAERPVPGWFLHGFFG